MKKTFYSEYAYVLGLTILAFGTALMERADFGMSMVVAPAYILHLKISQYLPFFTFGMSEYCLQFVLIAGLSLALRKFKKCYLLSFVTAVLYGLVLDLCIAVISFIPGDSYAFRITLYIIGLLCGSVGVSMFFHTYLAPGAYELVVKEIAAYTHGNISRIKTIYDLTSFAVSVVLSFCFFGFMQFKGINVGTLVAALLNGWTIGQISKFLDKRFEFKDGLKLRKYFEN